MFNQLGVIGCGLMGGSFALAMKRAGLVRRVIGYSKSPSTTEQLQLVHSPVAPPPDGATSAQDRLSHLGAPPLRLPPLSPLETCPHSSLSWQ